MLVLKTCTLDFNSQQFLNLKYYFKNQTERDEFFLFNTLNSNVSIVIWYETPGVYEAIFFQFCIGFVGLRCVSMYFIDQKCKIETVTLLSKSRTPGAAFPTSYAPVRYWKISINLRDWICIHWRKVYNTQIVILWNIRFLNKPLEINFFVMVLWLFIFFW